VACKKGETYLPKYTSYPYQIQQSKPHGRYIKKYFSVDSVKHSPYLKMFHMKVRSEFYIIYQYSCSTSISMFLEKWVDFKNHIK
jgi:hypothetical protein